MQPIFFRARFCKGKRSLPSASGALVRVLIPVLITALFAGCAATPPTNATTGSASPPPTASTFDCRDVDAQVLLDGTVQHLPTKACRDSSGGWQLMEDDSGAGYPAGTFIVYDPWLWGYPFFGFGASVVIVNHNHFHHDHFFHGSMMHRRHW